MWPAYAQVMQLLLLLLLLFFLSFEGRVVLDLVKALEDFGSLSNVCISLSLSLFGKSVSCRGSYKQ
jgi:hypothetical protein